MTIFAKYINETSIDKAPKNYKGKLNFNLDEEWCLEEGYLPLIENEKPSDGKTYKAKYELRKNKIIQKWEEIDNSLFTEKFKENQIKKLRNQYLNDIDWRVRRYEEQILLSIQTNDSQEEYFNLLRYKQYLRDIPEEKDFPNISIETFEKWKLNLITE